MPAPTRPPASPPTRPVGAHVPVAGGGLAAAGLRHADELGAEAIQVFTGNPRGWALPEGDPAQDAECRDRVATTGLPVFVHAAYLINPGSPDPAVQQRSSDSLAHSLRRGREIGAAGVVVHTGSAVDGDRAAGLRRAGRLLGRILDALPDGGPDLLLEPMAGQGHMLCAAVSDLGPYLDALGWHSRVGVCLDTCHLFAAGHDLTAPAGVASLLAEFADVTRAGGPEQGRRCARDPAGLLRLIHANDSKDSAGSRRDRHENIGAGRIGTAPFAALLHHPATEGVPFIIETPKPASAWAADIATLKRLRGSPA